MIFSWFKKQEDPWEEARKKMLLAYDWQIIAKRAPTDLDLSERYAPKRTIWLRFDNEQELYLFQGVESGKAIWIKFVYQPERLSEKTPKGDATV